MKFRPRTIAIASAIAALSFAAVPVAQAATGHHDRTATESWRDVSRDATGARHTHRTLDPHLDRSSKDNSRDVRDR